MNRNRLQSYPEGINTTEFLYFYFLFLLFASCCVSMTNNNTNSTVYATIFINLGYITCFDPNGSHSGVSSECESHVQSSKQIMCN
jgi:hypothetical protein